MAQIDPVELETRQVERCRSGTQWRGESALRHFASQHRSLVLKTGDGEQMGHPPDVARIEISSDDAGAREAGGAFLQRRELAALDAC